MWATRSLFCLCGGTPPTTPAMGASPPWTPRLPTPVGFGFAGVLGPTRGGVANVGNSFPLLSLRGDTPHNPRHGGLRPPGPPVCPPPWALGSPAFWVPLVAGLLMWATRSLFCLCGGTPPTTPRHGGLRPPGPPVCPPPWALGLPAFWAPLVAGLLMWATRYLFCLCGGTPPTTPRHGGLRPPGPPICPPPWALGSPALADLSPAKFSPFPRREGGQGVRSERHIPHTPWEGLRPLHPRFSYGRRRPTFFKEADFSRREGTPPNPLPGGFAPFTPGLINVGLGRLLESA
jgi:hypothetical protein